MNQLNMSNIIINNRCSCCIIEFNDIDELNYHITTSHVIKDDNYYICKSCEINFQNNDDLKYHISTMHTSKIYNRHNDKFVVDHIYHDSNLGTDYSEIGYISSTPEIMEECEIEINNVPFDQEYYNQLCLDDMAMFVN